MLRAREEPQNLIGEVGKEILEEDLRKREEMEFERFQNVPFLGDVQVEEMDMSAWAPLRLHPLLIEALMRLKFAKPTRIQEACIAAAAFQGKGVIAAAETGSGKTLAFGLPILQRLLDEEKNPGFYSGFGKNKPGGPLHALIISPTALQVCNLLRAVARFTDAMVVPIVEGMTVRKQQRLLEYRPQLVVGTPGRLCELMNAGEKHLLDLSHLSFFVLDEADRMVERGHFKELQTIMDMLPKTQQELASEKEKPLRRRKRREKTKVDEDEDEDVEPMKKRQTLVFSATLALPPGFKKKLKRVFFEDKSVLEKNENSVASLIQKAAMRSNSAIVDLTTKDILATKLEGSVIECCDEEKDAYLYYMLKVHGCGRTLLFCTSIAALRRVTAILWHLKFNVRTLHGQMQQKHRLKAMDRFKGTEDCVIVATDVRVDRGLDVTGIRTVIHYQLPHSAEIYVHRSGRIARADTDVISIAIVSPSDRAKYTTLCRALDKANGLPSFPIDVTYIPAILKRITLAFQDEVKLSWKRNAETLELDLEDSENDEETLVKVPVEKRELRRVQSFQQSGVTPVLARQLKEYTTPKLTPKAAKKGGKARVISANIPAKGRLLVIGQEAVEPLDALRNTTSTKPTPASTPKSRKGSGAAKSKRRRR